MTTQNFAANLQLNKFNSRIKNIAQVNLILSWNAVGDHDDQANCSHKLSSTNIRVSRNCKVFANGSSANIKFSKSQLSKIGQSVFEFLVRTLGPLLKTGLSIMKNILKPSVKSVLIILQLPVAASAANAAFQKRFLGQDWQYW